MIYLMSGIPASGKTTYIKQHRDKDDIIISRDKIRFNLLKEDEEYFSHEKEVISEFKRRIVEYDNSNSTSNLWIDATHISRKTRSRILACIKNHNVTSVYFEPNIELSITRNDKRYGRQKCAVSTIIDQAMRFEIPTLNEGFIKIIKAN